MLSEEALVSAIAAAVGGPSGNVVLGIGDDAAVLARRQRGLDRHAGRGRPFRPRPRRRPARSATGRRPRTSPTWRRWGPGPWPARGVRPARRLRRRGRDRRRDAEHGVPARRRRPLSRAGAHRVGDGARAQRAAGAALGRPPGRRARRDRAAGRPGRRAGTRAACRRGSPRDVRWRPSRPAMIDLSDGIATDAARLARGVRHRRGHRARAAAARRRCHDRAGCRRRRGLRAPGGAFRPTPSLPVPVTVVGRLTDGADVRACSTARVPTVAAGAGITSR